MSCAPRLLIPALCAVALAPATAAAKTTAAHHSAQCATSASARRHATRAHSAACAATVHAKLKPKAKAKVKKPAVVAPKTTTTVTTTTTTTPTPPPAVPKTTTTPPTTVTTPITTTVPVTVRVTTPTATPTPTPTTTTTTPAPVPPVTTANPPAAPLIVGINSDSWGWGDKVGLRQDQEAVTGAKWFREDVSWPTVEPSAGVFDFSHFDVVFGDAAARGIHILPLLTDTPTWVGADGNTIPSDPTAYADYVAHVVARYGPHGSFWAANPQWAAYAPTTFELWNEAYYTTTYNPGNYARLVKAAATAGRAADPSAKFVLSAEVYGDGHTSWVDAMYAAVPDLDNYFDDVAFHAYGKDLTGLSGDGENQLRRIETLRADFVSHGASDKAFWLTEVGYSTCGTANAQCVTPAQQASDFQTMFDDMRTTYASYVRAVFVYRYNDYDTSGGFEQSFGLSASDGTPKPAMAVIRSEAAAS